MPEENTIVTSVDKIAEEKKEIELAKQAYKVANQRPKTEAENIRYSNGVRPTKGRKLAMTTGTGKTRTVLGIL